MLLACLTSITWLEAQPFKAMNLLGVQAAGSNRLVRREQPAAFSQTLVLWAKTAGVYDPAASDKHLNSHRYVCVYVVAAGVMCRGIVRNQWGVE